MFAMHYIWILFQAQNPHVMMPVFQSHVQDAKTLSQIKHETNCANLVLNIDIEVFEMHTIFDKLWTCMEHLQVGSQSFSKDMVDFGGD